MNFLENNFAAFEHPTLRDGRQRIVYFILYQCFASAGTG
jgi:hypothetical protein